MKTTFALLLALSLSACASVQQPSSSPQYKTWQEKLDAKKRSAALARQQTIDMALRDMMSTHDVLLLSSPFE